MGFPTHEGRETKAQWALTALSLTVSETPGDALCAITFPKLLWNHWKPPVNCIKWPSTKPECRATTQDTLKRKAEGRDGVEYLPNTCNTSNPDVPHYAPSGSHPQPSAGEVGQPGECTVGVRNAGCLPHTGRWILHSCRWEWGDGQHQKTKRWEVNVIYKFYQHQVFCSPQTRQWVCVLRFSEQQKSFSQKYFSSSFLVHNVNHCGLTNSVQEIHPYVTLLHWFTNTTGDCSGQ